MSDDVWQGIRRSAARQGLSAGEYVEATMARALACDEQARVPAVEALAALDLPFEEWNEMEQVLADTHSPCAGERAYGGRPSER